jgi:hypothetical protein
MLTQTHSSTPNSARVRPPACAKLSVPRVKSWRGVHVYTIGHSTRTLDELVALLRAFDVRVLADIRTIPRSRHNPQFNAVPWRCHRSLVADALTVRGAKVDHISSVTRASAHRITSFARVEGKRVTYPGSADPVVCGGAERVHAGGALGVRGAGRGCCGGA